MNYMFRTSYAFNQDIGNWNTKNVTDMGDMFGYSVFNQNLGAWDVSKVTTLASFSTGSFSQTNYDKILSGWSDINVSTGEVGLQSSVTFGMGTTTYTDATARQYLIDTYNWTITDGGVAAGAGAFSVIVGSNTTADTLDSTAVTEALIMHGLGGNDILIGGTLADTLVGGAGNDTLTGNGGADTFTWKFTNEGSDTVVDFSSTLTYAAGGDRLDLSVLLDGYVKDESSISDFITVVDNAGVAQLKVDADGVSNGTSYVYINMTGYTTTTVTQTILKTWETNGNLVLS
jgi:surface protein